MVYCVVYFDKLQKYARWKTTAAKVMETQLQIDLLTGKYTPLSTELVVSINIGAAFIQAYGWNSMENTFSREGKLETRVHSEKNIPSIASCPSKFNATLLKSEVLHLKRDR